MEAQPRAGLVYGVSLFWYNWLGQPEDTGADSVRETGVPTDTLYEPPSLLARVYPLGQAHSPVPSNFLMRREALESVGGFDETFRGIYEDLIVLLKLCIRWPIFVSSEHWNLYRIHAESACAVATREGTYGTVRGLCLQRFQRYLLERRILDTEIWRPLQRAVQAARIQLRTDGASVAHLMFKPEDPAWVRISIEKTNGTAWDVQLNRPYYDLRAKQQYSVCFRTRADQPRNISVGVALAHPPWDGLGLYRQIALTCEWQTFEFDFSATQDSGNSRVHFDLGESEPSVELRDLCLRAFPGGPVIETTLAEIELEKTH